MRTVGVERKKRKIGEREWKWISVAYETLDDPLNLSEPNSNAARIVTGRKEQKTLHVQIAAKAASDGGSAN